MLKFLNANGRKQRDGERDGAGRWLLRISWCGVPGPSLAKLAATQAGMKRAVGANPRQKTPFPHPCHPRNPWLKRFCSRPCLPQKFLNYFGPWTADVQGPLLNSCVMNVVMTALAARPVKNRCFPAPTTATLAAPPGFELVVNWQLNHGGEGVIKFAKLEVWPGGRAVSRFARRGGGMARAAVPQRARPRWR